MAKMVDCQDLEIYSFSLHTFNYVSLFLKEDKTRLVQDNNFFLRILKKSLKSQDSRTQDVNKYQLEANTFPGISQNYGKR